MDDLTMAVRGSYDIRTVAEDCTALLTLRREWVPVADDGFEEEFRNWWSRERHHRHALVAYSGDDPVGMANGQIFSRMPVPGRPKAEWLYGANVYVAAQYRRNGIGRSLMSALIDFARVRGMVRVVLAPSEMSIPLYESLGFRAAHDLMRLELPS